MQACETPPPAAAAAAAAVGWARRTVDGVHVHDPRVHAARAGALVVEAGARESVPDARREVQQQYQQEDAPQREPQRSVRLQVSLARLCHQTA